MEIALNIVGILVLGFLVNVVLKQTYNFVFFMGKKPLLWVLIVTVVSALLWFFCALLGWSVSIPAGVATIAFFMNIPPSSTIESKAQAQEMRSEMGLKHGALLYRVGLGGFAAASVAGWVIFYGQSCNSAGQCSSFF